MVQRKSCSTKPSFKELDSVNLEFKCPPLIINTIKRSKNRITNVKNTAKINYVARYRVTYQRK